MAFLGSVECKSSRIRLRLGKPGTTSPIKARKIPILVLLIWGQDVLLSLNLRRETEFVAGVCSKHGDRLGVGTGSLTPLSTAIKVYILTNTLRVTYEATV